MGFTRTPEGGNGREGPVWASECGNKVESVCNPALVSCAPTWEGAEEFLHIFYIVSIFLMYFNINLNIIYIYTHLYIHILLVYICMFHIYMCVYICVRYLSYTHTCNSLVHSKLTQALLFFNIYTFVYTQIFIYGHIFACTHT